MKVLKHGPDEVSVLLTSKEFVMLNNALNEVCNGIQIPDFGFNTRLGSSRADMRLLLSQISDAIQNSK